MTKISDMIVANVWRSAFIEVIIAEPMVLVLGTHEVLGKFMDVFLREPLIILGVRVMLL